MAVLYSNDGDLDRAYSATAGMMAGNFFTGDAPWISSIQLRLLYRLAQEGLNNIRKHADAEQATVTLVGSFPNIILRIEDNGKGFDVKARELALCNEKRMGLRSMKERVNLLGGQMTIQSRLMQGTKVFIKIPYKGQKDESEKAHINH